MRLSSNENSLLRRGVPRRMRRVSRRYRPMRPAHHDEITAPTGPPPRKTGGAYLVKELTKRNSRSESFGPAPRQSRFLDRGDTRARNFAAHRSAISTRTKA